MRPLIPLAAAILLVIPGLLAGAQTDPTGQMLEERTVWFDPIDASSLETWTLASPTGELALAEESERTALRLEGGTEAEPARALSPSLDAQGPVVVTLVLASGRSTWTAEPDVALRFLDSQGDPIAVYGVRSGSGYVLTPIGWESTYGTLCCSASSTLQFTFDGTETRVALNGWAGFHGETVPALSSGWLDRIELVSEGRWAELDLVTVTSPGTGLHDSFMRSSGDQWPADWRLVREPTGVTTEWAGLENVGVLERSNGEGAHATWGRVRVTPSPAERWFAATDSGWSATEPTTIFLTFRPRVAGGLTGVILAGLDATEEPTFALFLTNTGPGLGSPDAIRVLNMVTGPTQATEVAREGPTDRGEWWTVRVDTDPTEQVAEATVNGWDPVAVPIDRLGSTTEIALGDPIGVGSLWAGGLTLGGSDVDELIILPRP